MAIGRVRDQRTFRELRHSGTRGRSGPVAVTALVGPKCNSGASGARVAFAVGRRIGPAVVRNRVRRRLRAIATDLDLAPGAYLVTVHPDVVGLGHDDLQHHLAAAVRKASA